MLRPALAIGLLMAAGCASTSRETESGLTTGNRYSVIVQTSNIAKAGTSARVYIELEGTSGRTGEIHLDRANYDDFKQGDRDTYSFEHAPLGDIRNICLRHDNSKPDPGWHVGTVIVEEQKTGQRWQADFNRWLAENEDDRQLKACRPAQRLPG